jgi:hypothetical protein
VRKCVRLRLEQSNLCMPDGNHILLGNVYAMNVILRSRGNFYIYEGESNENLKFVIKNRNLVPLSCKLAILLLVV